MPPTISYRPVSWRADPIDTRSCRGSVHALECGHTVRSSSPLCSSACHQPRFGEKRARAHRCRRCREAAAERTLLNALEQNFELRERLEELRWIHRHEYGMEEQLERSEDLINERESMLHSMVPQSVWRRYLSLGLIGFREQVHRNFETLDDVRWPDGDEGFDGSVLSESFTLPTITRRGAVDDEVDVESLFPNSESLLEGQDLLELPRFGSLQTPPLYTDFFF